MGKESWTPGIAVACIFWGTAVLFNQHHLSNLIPALGGYLLCCGIGLMAVFLLRGRKSR